MEREDIKDTLEYAAELLQADPNWLDFARKPSTPDVMGDWIKRNQPDIADLFATLSWKECMDAGFLGAAMAFGVLMTD